MRMAVFIGLLAVIVFGAPAANAQVPAAASVMPAGFKIVSDQKMGEAIIAEGRKPNDACPKPHSDPEIHIGYSWRPNPAAEQTVAMLARVPEEPAGTSMGVTRSEPAGKLAYRGGVLIWRKYITPWVGAGRAPDLVLIDGSWVGVAATGLLGVSVNSFCGTKEAALGWIDGILDKASVKKQ